MSFLSIFKKIGSVAISVEHVAAPIAETLLPQFAVPIAQLDGIFGRLTGAIATVEMNSPVDKTGDLKSQAVQADFATGLGLTQEVLALEGKKLTYDSQALQDAIAAQVSAFNAMKKVKDSFKISGI